MAAPLQAPPPSSRDELGPAGRRALVGGVVVAHVLGGWALLQVDAVREAVAQVAPVLMVDMIAPPTPEPPAPAPPPKPQPKVIAPAPPPLLAAAPTPSPAPPTFVVPEPPPPAPPTPLVTPPVPPAPPAQAPAPAQPEPKKIPASAVQYVTQPRLNFPLLSKRSGESGMVVLRITVDAGGRLKAATVHRSSGFARIDQAALDDIRSARFQPQMEDGKPIEWQTLARLDYVLDR